MRNFDGYPDSFGSHRAVVFPVQGPASYVQIVPGAAPANATGGLLVQDKQSGINFYEFMTAGLTDSGVYRVECIPTTRSGVITSNSPSASQPGHHYRLRWVVVATGAEVAAAFNLSAEIVRVFALGVK